MRLDQRQRLKKLVHSTETAGEDDEGAGVLDKHGLAHEKVVEIERDVQVGVGELLKGQFDIATDREIPAVLRPLVAGLHDAGSAPGNNAEAGPGQQTSCLDRRLVRWIAGFSAGRAEDGYGGGNMGQGVEAVDKLAHNA